MKIEWVGHLETEATSVFNKKIKDGSWLLCAGCDNTQGVVSLVFIHRRWIFEFNLEESVAQLWRVPVEGAP